LQRDQLGAVHHLAEGVVEHVVAERRSEVADDHRVGETGGLLELFEVAFDFLVHDQRDVLVAALATVPDGERRRGDQLAVTDSQPEAGELLERSIA
jgi:hypothetical protein